MSNSDLICGIYPRVKIPEIESNQEIDIIVGIDEAGRGCVLGSLVYCAAFWPTSEHEAISKLGFNDSKQLTEEQREKMFNKIYNSDVIGYVVEEITPQTISESMQRRTPVSLNNLSYEGVIRMLETIRQYSHKYHVTHVYVDTVGDPNYYKSRLITALGNDYGEFIVEKKADATYKVVS